jgi:hypothetical protein
MVYRILEGRMMKGLKWDSTASAFEVFAKLRLWMTGTNIGRRSSDRRLPDMMLES